MRKFEENKTDEMKSCFYETETHIYDILFSFSRKMEIFLNHIGLKHQLEI